MKKNKLIYGLALMLVIAVGCSKRGIDDDISLSTPPPSNLGTNFVISDDNSGNVAITPLASSGSNFRVDFGDGGALSDTVKAGSSITHAYPEGSYTVSTTAYDLLWNGTTSTFPLAVTYKAPEDVDFTINGDVKIAATASFAHSFLIYYGDVANETGTPLALGETAPSHVYPDGGPYYIKVKAISGNATWAGAATTESSTKQVWGLPITFENPDVDNFFGTFGNVGFSKVANPDPTGLNTSATVGKYDKPNGAETWSGTYTPLSIPMNFATGNKVKVLLYNPNPLNIGKLLNVELEAGDPDTGAPGNGTGVLKVPITTSNAWEELTFDFSTIPAVPATSRFAQLVLRFNDIAGGEGETIYLDNFRLTN